MDDGEQHGRFAAADPRAPTRNLAFEDADIRTLVDTHATKAAILAELDRMCGEIAERHRRSGRERDVLFVFLSGHGMRVFDQDVPSLFFVNHDLAGYEVHWGKTPDATEFSATIADPRATTFDVNGLGQGTWYFRIASKATTGETSAFTDPASKTIQ